MEVDEHAAVADRPDTAGDPHAFAGFGACGQPGVVPLKVGRLVAAGKGIRIRINPSRLEALELA